MILSAHNAHLVSLDGPPVPADPDLNVAGNAGPNRWSGDSQAYVDQDQTELVIGNQRVNVIDAIIDLPANFPVMPNENDVLTVRYLGGAMATFKVRMIDAGMVLLGKLRLRCRPY